MESMQSRLSDVWRNEAITIVRERCVQKLVGFLLLFVFIYELMHSIVVYVIKVERARIIYGNKVIYLNFDGPFA
jgi:hypothetical protein